ncbi:early boundary activity 3 isoform 1-T1 [Glossina fuscipes fuscipes]
MFFDETAQEYCRMSWFLIETDEGLCLGSNKQPNGKRFLVIIHSMELIDDESDNMYVDRKVRFMWKQGIVEGKIRLASDERDSVDNELKMLQENEAGNAVSQSHKPNNYIVQYRRGTDTIIYRILREKESVEDMQKSVILEDDIPYVAKILYMNESQELLLQELNLLKDKCFEATFTESRDSEKLENDWLLIQYSTGPLNLIYKIINYSDTVWQNENKFKDVVAYITASDVTFQGIVLSKSQDYDELKKTLQVIEKVGLTSAFPLDPFSEGTTMMPDPIYSK